MHWAKKREKERIREEVPYTLRPKDGAISQPVDVHLHRTGWNRMDISGVIESAKPVRW